MIREWAFQVSRYYVEDRYPPTSPWSMYYHHKAHQVELRRECVRVKVQSTISQLCTTVEPVTKLDCFHCSHLCSNIVGIENSCRDRSGRKNTVRPENSIESLVNFQRKKPLIKFVS